MNKKPKLSILIPSLTNREHFLKRILRHLNAQIEGIEDQVEILTEIDAGEMTIGEKRNLLVSRAQGEYLCFVDCDDQVSENYVELILKAIESKPDCVSMNLIQTWDGGKAERSFHYLQFKNEPWFDIADPLQPDHRIYFRSINHLNPVLTRIAKLVPFPSISNGEDKDYSYRIQEHLNTTVIIEQPIYFYLFRSNK